MRQTDDAAFKTEMSGHHTNGVGIPRIASPDAMSHMTGHQAATRLARDDRICMQETGAVRTTGTRYQDRGRIRTLDGGAHGGMDALRQAIRGLWMIRHAV